MFRCLAVALVLAALTGCAGRFSNPLTCTRGGSPTVWEFPNSQGSYAGIDDTMENCGRKG